MPTRRFVLSGLLATCLPSFGAAQEAPAQRRDGWSVATPAEAGLDPDALRELVKAVDAGASMRKVHAVLIEHEGRLVFEHYWPGEEFLLYGESLGVVEHGPTTLHGIRSISKSVTSLILGIALGGSAEAALARPIASFFPEREGLGRGQDTVTLHHVLTMTAGLAWNELIVPYDARNDFVQLLRADDPVGFVLSKELRDAPGQRWVYNSGLTDVTAAVIENVTGRALADYADEVLFGPLGITEYDWHHPRAWGPEGLPSASAGLRLRARDLAKIGSLILHQGKWQGRQVVPATWVEMSTQRHVEEVRGATDTYGYGYYWYPGTLLSGQRVILAAGYGDQRVFVLPGLGLAITVFAGNYDDPGWEVGERILGRIIRALR